VAVFPNSTNTGVPAGTSLTAYTGPMTITTDGTVIDGKIITGTLRVTADNVVIKNSQINYSGMWGVDAEGANNITIQDSDIVGPGYSADSNAGILGSGTFLRNDVSKSENGIVLTGGSSTVVGNYVHDLQDNAADPHYDGISVQGGQDGVLIEGNTVLARDTSDIFIKNDFGPINNVTVNANYLAGEPGITLYVDGRANGGPITNVSVTNNYMEKGYYDYFSIDNSSPVLSGNIYLAEGEAPGEWTPTGGIDMGGSTGGTDSGSGTGTGTDTGGTGTGGTDSGSGTGGTDTGGDSGATATVYTGTAGNDVMPLTGQSNSGSEKFYALAGDDVLQGGAGADHLDGGDGNDTASYAGSNTGVNVDLKTGSGSGGDATGDTIVSIGHLTGSSYGDALNGNDNVNILNGGAGNDTLSASGGNDTLTGGTGADTMRGGAGNDSYNVDQSGDVVDESASGSGGYDTVSSTVSFKLGSALGSVENLTIVGTANVNGTGNKLVNTITGNSGSNILSGGSGGDRLYGGAGTDVLKGDSGDDRLDGGLGADTLVGGTGHDTFVFDTALASNTADVIDGFNALDDVFQLENGVFTGLATTGTLAASEFVRNTTGLAKDANDHIIYETDTGWLNYDYNGSADGGGVHFARISANLQLSSADFQVV